MANDEFHNAAGYFKDPGTGQDLTGDEPRLVTCHPGEPFNWPRIALSDGNIVKLCYRLWNADEKQCYKEYRNGGTCVKSERRPKADKPVKQTECKSTDEPEKQVVKYSKESAASIETLKILACCDRCIGVSQIAGVTYALITKRGSSVVHHIPRSYIPDEEFERLCCGDEY